MLGECIAMLRDPSVPEHRVFRKVAVLVVLLAACLLYFRHIHMGFGFGEPLLVSVALLFALVGVVGVFGGLLASSFYKTFLSDVGARNQESTAATFFAEWLFALAAPVLGVIGFGLLQSHSG